MAASKKYGLIITKKADKKQTLSKPSIFGDDSDEEDSRARVNKTIQKAAKQALLKRQTQLEIEKALEEDPTVYEYDSIYDDMQKAKTGTTENKKKDKEVEKKPKYIKNLLKAAELRKRENERRTERQVQRDREKEKGMYDDSESFVTGSYKKKLQEMKEEEERERQKNEMDERMDVTKQKDLSGFYRHLLNQTTGEETVPSNVPDKKGSMKQETSKPSSSTGGPTLDEDRDLTPSHSSGSSDSESDKTSHRKSQEKQETDRRDKDISKRSTHHDRRERDSHRTSRRDSCERQKDEPSGSKSSNRRDRNSSRREDRPSEKTDDKRANSKERLSARATRETSASKEEISKSKQGEPAKRKKDSESESDANEEKVSVDTEKPLQGPQLPAAASTSKNEKDKKAGKFAKHTAGESLMDAKARYLARKKNRHVALAPADD